MRSRNTCVTCASPNERTATASSRAKQDKKYLRWDGFSWCVSNSSSSAVLLPSDRKGATVLFTNSFGRHMEQCVLRQAWQTPVGATAAPKTARLLLCSVDPLLFRFFCLADIFHIHCTRSTVFNAEFFFVYLPFKMGFRLIKLRWQKNLRR